MALSNTSTMLIPVILCGGVGSSLWPVSRAEHPKPFIRLDDGQSLLQKSYLCAASLTNVTDIMTVTNRDLFFKIEDEYRELKPASNKEINNHFILEPMGRNTAPAIAAACLQIAEIFGNDALVLVFATEHLIAEQAVFNDAVAKACELAKEGKLLRFNFNATAEMNQENRQSDEVVLNSGMHCFSVGVMLKEMKEHCPKILEQTKLCLENAKKTSGENFSQIEFNKEDFEPLVAESIDTAVIEQTFNTGIVECDCAWSDTACWRSLGDLTIADENNNRIQGETVVQNIKNCTIKSEGRVIGAVGIKNLIIIDTPDALLVVDKESTHEVKHIYEKLKEEGHEVHKTHRTVFRPWGSYTVLEEGPCFKIKRIEVKPGGHLSLQMHHHRSEHWVVISGKAKIQNDEKEMILNINESTFIPVEHKHRLENIADEQLIIIEVQTGEYLGEDDIVRFQDVYGRVS